MAKSTGFTRKALLNSILVDDKLIELQKLLKMHCIPYATSQGREEMFGNPDVTELDFEDFRTGTWLISKRNISQFVKLCEAIGENVYVDTFKVIDGQPLQKVWYVMTPYGIVREVPHRDVTDKYIMNSDGRNGYWQLSPEFLVESYKRKDVLFYVPTYAIACMERWTKKKIDEKSEKKTRLQDLSREHYEEEKDFRLSLILKGGNTPEIEKLVDEMMDYIATCSADVLEADITQFEEQIRSKLRATALGEEVFDQYEYMLQQQIKARSELRTVLV